MEYLLMGSPWRSDNELGPSWVFKSNIPFILPAGNGATVGLQFTSAAGAFQLVGAALPSAFAYARAYMYFPANGIAGTGNAAGWYYVEMSSATVGVVYNNTYTTGRPRDALPGTGKVAFSGVTLNAWLTQTTGVSITGPNIDIPSSVATEFAVATLDTTYSCSGSTNNKYQTATVLGASAMSLRNINTATAITDRQIRRLFCRGNSSAMQANWGGGTGTNTSVLSNTGYTPGASNYTASYQLRNDINTDWSIMEGFYVEIYP